MKYLIISTNAMGDTYLSASAINVIKSSDKCAEIDFISITKCKPILEVLSLNKIYIVEKNILSLFEAILNLRKINYDYTFNFFPGLVNTFFLLFTKGKRKGGYINLIRKRDWYDRKQKVFIKGANDRKLTWLPSENYLERVKLVLSVFFDFPALNSFQKKIMEFHKLNSDFSNCVIIHPFSRSKERTIGHTALKELVKYFQRHNSVFVVGESMDFWEITDSTIPALADLKFIELVEVILSCKLFIAVDSFPIHIADAHNTNFIGIFGPTDPKAVLVNFDKAIKLEVARLDLVSFEFLRKGIEHFLSN